MVLDQVARDSAKAPVSAKTTKKQEAQWDVIKQFLGEDTLIVQANSLRPLKPNR
jgi:hypothetical protein